MTAPIRKKLIEVSIPLEAINAASAKEQDNPFWKGHPRTLHPWWARRPLAACRAVLFAQLVDDPSSWPDRFPTEEAQDAERRRLHKIIADMVPWEASNNEVILNKARWEIARSVAWGLGEEPPPASDTKAILDYLQIKAPPVYDPFSGRGSIPLEAQRLGLRAYGSDLNPVAVLISKALVEIPPKFAGLSPVNPKAQAELNRGGRWNGNGAQGLAEDVTYYGQWMSDEAKRHIAHLYPKAKRSDGSEATVIAWLWARTVRSPDPAAKGTMVPLVSSFMLSTKEGKKAWVEPIVNPKSPGNWRFEVKAGELSKSDEERFKQGTKTGRGANFTCILTGAAITGDYVKGEGASGRMSTRLFAIVAEGNRGRAYLSPTEAQEQIASTAEPLWRPEGELPHDPRNFWTVQYGLNTFASLFTERQLVALTTFSDLISEVREKALADARVAGLPDDDAPLHSGGLGATAYADAIVTYLGLLISKSVDYNCNLVTWNTTNQNLTHLFTAQKIPFIVDFAEANPFTAGVSFNDFAKSLNETVKRLPAVSHGIIDLKDARRPIRDAELVAVCTDPPYFENISYADLSDIFYLWQARSLKRIWPDLYRTITTQKMAEIVASPYRFGGKKEAANHFMESMTEAVTAMAQSSLPETPITMFYAYKQQSEDVEGAVSPGWAGFLQALSDAGLGIDGTWPIRTERNTRSVSLGTNALASSIVLVCRKRTANAEIITRADFIRQLKHEMPDAIDKIRKAGVGPVDMQQSVIGPGMGVFSHYSKVLEDNDSAMTVRTALSLINRVWEEIENELDTAFDAETQVALAWYATYGFDARASGELITLANAKNIASNALFSSGVFKDMKGKAGLIPREELPIGWQPNTDKTLTVWECVQHTARVLNATDGGGQAAARLVAQMGSRAADARTLAYRLFEIATKKGWASEALIYNELAQEWPKLEDLASSASAAPTEAQGQLALG